MEEECTCNYFDGKETPPQKIMDNFKAIAISKAYCHPIPDDGEFTTLLKCPKCNSYYLMNVHNSLYPNQETVTISRYKPTIEEEGLVKIIKSLEGIITDIELNEYSEMRSIIKKQFNKKKIIKPLFNESKN